MPVLVRIRKFVSPLLSRRRPHLRTWKEHMISYGVNQAVEFIQACVIMAIPVCDTRIFCSKQKDESKGKSHWLSLSFNMAVPFMRKDGQSERSMYNMGFKAGRREGPC